MFVGAKCRTAGPSSRFVGWWPAGSVIKARASCRLTHLRCWVVPGRDSSSSAGSVRRVPSLHSAVSLRLGLCRARYSSGASANSALVSGFPASRRSHKVSAALTPPTLRLPLRCSSPSRRPDSPASASRRCTSIRRIVPVRERPSYPASAASSRSPAAAYGLACSTFPFVCRHG